MLDGADLFPDTYSSDHIEVAIENQNYLILETKRFGIGWFKIPFKFYLTWTYLFAIHLRKGRSTTPLKTDKWEKIVFDKENWIVIRAALVNWRTTDKDIKKDIRLLEQCVISK